MSETTGGAGPPGVILTGFRLRKDLAPMGASDAVTVNGKVFPRGHCARCGLNWSSHEQLKCPQCGADRPARDAEREADMDRLVVDYALGRCPIHGTKKSPVGVCQDCLDAKEGRPDHGKAAWTNHRRRDAVRGAARTTPDPAGGPS